MSVYQLKSRFQNLLRPVVRNLANAGITANQVTIAAALVSVALGLFLFLAPGAIWFALVPVWLFLRMALNAIDGMLAREHGQKTALGGFLNELGDVVSDAALYLPFALISPFSLPWIGALVLLSVLTEFAGVLAAAIAAKRTYDGPMGKSDRAVVFGILGAWIALGSALPGWLFFLQPVIAALLVVTTVKRIRSGLAAS